MGSYKSRGIATIALIAVISGIAMIVGIVSSKYLGNDNAVEQAAEAVIEEETGIDIDLSPEEEN